MDICDGVRTWLGRVLESGEIDVFNWVVVCYHYTIGSKYLFISLPERRMLVFPKYGCFVACWCRLCFCVACWS